MTIDKTSEGAWRISAIIDGYLVTRRYYFYSRKEAIKRFKTEQKPD